MSIILIVYNEHFRMTHHLTGNVTRLGTFDKICVFTDMEPDDALALHALRSFLDPDAVEYIIVTESEEDKRSICNVLTRDTFPNASIIAGATSDKSYPIVEMSAAVNVVDEFLPTTQITAKDAIKMFISAHSDPLFICLAPPRDLLAAYKEDVEALQHSTLVFYGGFNARTLFKTETNLADFFNNAFKCVFFYESRSATGSENTIGSIENPSFFQTIDDHIPHVLRMLSAWNHHMGKIQGGLFPALTQCLVDAYFANDQAAINVLRPKFHRMQKHVCTLIDNNDKTILLADWAAVIAAFHPLCPGTIDVGIISFAEHSGYTNWEKNEVEGRVHWPTAIGREWMIQSLIHILE